MGAKNKVIAGDYEGRPVSGVGNSLYIVTGFMKTVDINRDTVESYEVVDEEIKTSAVSAVGRGLVGSFFLGPAGLLAGLTAKKKGVHVVAIKFKDGKKSLLELDDKLFKVLTRTLF